MEGIVRVQLPSGLYSVEIEGARLVTAHAGAGPKRNFLRLVAGACVEVELMPRDATRGRIVRVVGRGQQVEGGQS